MKNEDAKNTKAHRYAGGNERLDTLLSNFPGDTVWVVDGVDGRKIHIAETAEQAVEQYNAQPNKWRKDS